MAMTFDLESAKIGQYVYGRHYSLWGVWQCTYRDDYRTRGTHITDFPTWKEAKDYVYKMNGWTIK